jgi:hypothetical protein
MKKREPKNRASVDISGTIRAVQVGGRWYVVGGDLLIPARDETEATAIASELTNEGFASDNEGTNDG